MLPSENRLKGQANYDEVKKKGKVYQSNDFAISILRRKNKDKPKIGIIVSKKISAIAVSRNRIKRAIFESVRRNLKLFPKGLVMAFLVKRSMAKKTTDEIMKQVDGFIRAFSKTPGF